MSRLLAINTAAAVCSVGLYQGGRVLLRESKQERQAAQRILPLVQELLQAAQLTLADIDAIVVVSGPGSFTGMRIGVGVAQGLSLAQSIPVIPLSTLAVVAWEAEQDSAGQQRAWLVALPARDQEIYLGAYRVQGDNGLQALHKEWVGDPLKLASALSAVSVAGWHVAGSAWSRQDLPAQLGVEPLSCHSELQGSMQAVCELGLDYLRQNRAVSADQLLPNYVKEQMDYSV